MSTPMYIAEITPAHLRGRMVAVNQIAIVGGIAGVSFLNYFIARCGDQDWNIATGWRWMFAVGVVPSIAFLLLLLPIPESPRWLAEKGHEDRAAAVLAHVGGSEFARAEIASIRQSLGAEKGRGTRAVGRGELFSRRLAAPLLLGIALASLQQVTGINAFLYFGASIFKGMSHSTGVDAGLLQQIVINGACMLATVVAIATVDLWGRKPLMIVGATGMGVSLAAMGVMAQRMSDAAAAGNTMLAAIIVYIACFGLSVGPVTWVILSEIFPTSVRGRALGLATFCLWMSDYAVTQTFPMMNAEGFVVRRQLQPRFPVLRLRGVLRSPDRRGVLRSAGDQGPLAGRNRGLLEMKTVFVLLGRQRPGAGVAGLHAALIRLLAVGMVLIGTAAARAVEVRVVLGGESAAKAVDCRRMLVGPGVNQPDPHPGYAGFVGWDAPLRLRDGTLLVSFSTGYWHASPPTPLRVAPDTLVTWRKLGMPTNIDAPRGGRAMLIRSTDNGRTWSKPRTIIDTPWDDRSPAMVELPDGTLVCSFFTYPGEGDLSKQPDLACRTGIICSGTAARPGSRPHGDCHPRLSATRRMARRCCSKTARSSWPLMARRNKGWPSRLACSVPPTAAGRGSCSPWSRADTR